MIQLRETLISKPSGVLILMTIPGIGPHLVGKLRKIEDVFERDSLNPLEPSSSSRLCINELCNLSIQQVGQNQFAWVPMPIPFYQGSYLTPKMSDLVGLVIEGDTNDIQTAKIFSSYKETLMNLRAQNSGLKLTR